MDLAIALGHRARVEEFQRKHRIALLTLVFTDFAGATTLKQDLSESAALELIERHHVVVREVLVRFKEAEEISIAGDSFFIVFTKPSDAVRFSLLLQARLRRLSEDTGHGLHDRLSIHVGEVFSDERSGGKDLYELQVTIATRLLGLAEVRQILMTRFAFDSARQVLRGQDLDGLGPLSWMSHGPYRIDDVEDPIEICGVSEDGKGFSGAPASTEEAQRFEMPDSDAVHGWRPAIDQIVPKTHWLLERKLGEGGFGEVWLACHSKLRERRVIQFCFRADRVRSLKREVTLFRVMRERFGHHPRIVGIQEVCFDQPPFYLVMDYARGQDLKGWCAERGGSKAISRATLIEIAAQVADALHAAHEAGVIHRDVKPGNILVSGAGTSPADVNVKLTDFGIGQVVSPDVLAGMTRSGFTQTVVSAGGSAHGGTHIYMAPELIANKPASTRSDTYSLGVVLYQMLVGDFSQPLTVDWTHEIDDPLLREDLAKCFAGNPLQRWPRVIQFAESLRQLEVRRKEHPIAVAAPSNPEVGVTTNENLPPEPVAPPAPVAPKIPQRDPQLKPGLVDLSRFYNAALDEDWYGEPRSNLATLPRGRTAVLAGTEFDLRGLIQLSSQMAATTRPGLPERVSGIPLSPKCQRLHFLHAALCLESDGTTIGTYVIRYADSQRVEVPIIYGNDLREWCFDYDPVREIRGAVVAWTGRNAGQHPVRLYKATWENPWPEINVVSLDFVSAMTDAAPFLIALTAE
jgi:serine/threonine protein kinase/class 3 adenylate cyclase